MLFACSCQHMLNTFPFIQRTEQVLIELDISAIEEYVIILLLLMFKSRLFHNVGSAQHYRPMNELAHFTNWG